MAPDPALTGERLQQAFAEIAEICRSPQGLESASRIIAIALRLLAESSPGTRCVHGAKPALCAFQGCPNFAADGPRDEKWAFRPEVTEEDVALALHENQVQHSRAPGSASPIHLVVHRKMRVRLEARSPASEIDLEDGC